MGHKISPQSYRLPWKKDWQSRWFVSQKSAFAKNLLADQKIRQYTFKKFGFNAAIDKIEIERRVGELKIIISTARPGIIIGRQGQGVIQLKEKLEKEIAISPIKLDIIEVKKPELSASIMAQTIATQIEKRIAYRRAIKQALEKIMASGAKGVRIAISGRLGGAEIARREKFSNGSVPLATLRANIDYAQVDALTKYGTIGIKVWINIPEVQ